MGTIIKLVCIFCKNVVALAWMDGELWHGQAQNEVTLAFKLNFTLKVKANCPKNNRDLNSSWPSATYMRRDFQCLFPQRPRYVALISVLISPVPHTWGVTNGSLLASPPNSRRSPASLISPAPHICGASRTPILTRVVWKILNVVTNILVVLPDYGLP